MLNKEDEEYLNSIRFISTIYHPEWSGFDIGEGGFTIGSVTIICRHLLRKHIENIRRVI